MEDIKKEIIDRLDELNESQLLLIKEIIDNIK